MDYGLRHAWGSAFGQVPRRLQVILVLGTLVGFLMHLHLGLLGFLHKIGVGKKEEIEFSKSEKNVNDRYLTFNCDALRRCF